MSKVKTLVPKLRFPEFKDAGGWEYTPLAKLLMSSPDYGVNAAAVPFSERLPKYLRITDISDDGAYLSNKKVSVDLEPTDEIYLDEGDIVLARTGASVGKSYRYRKEDGKLVFAGFLIRVKPDKTKLVSGYLANFLTTRQYWDWVAANSARSGQPGINSTEYSSLAIPLPPDDLAEQQKIASCLSSLDRLITAHTQKLNALKTYKKGLMQQLFPPEGETVPRLRFPEFRGDGEWEPQPLSALIDLISGMHLSPEDYSTAGEVPYFTGPSDFTNELPNVTKWTKRTSNVSRAEDTLITVKGSGVGETWYSTLSAVAMGRQLMAVRSKIGSSRFMFQFLLTKRSRFKDLGSGNLIPGLSRNAILELEACFPSPAEQQRIASCLTSLDTLITEQSRKLVRLMTHKKGLMQGLFPSRKANVR